MKILIFIPARGGSKGIPGKNMVILNGKPLIYYTLMTAKQLMQNKSFMWFPFVSTDDHKTATYCKKQGFHMDYMRPKKLAEDKSPMIDGILDALIWLKQNKGIIPDAILLLQPTTPLRKTANIINAIKEVNSENNFSLVSITRMREHPYECVKMNKQGWSYLSKPIGRPAGRQQYNDNYFFIDGSFYFGSLKFVKKYLTFLIENKTKFYLLDHLWPIDIDEKDDLLIAEAFLKKYGKN